MAERYWTYLLLRMGQRLEILPLRGDPHRQWASLAMLVQSEFDDKSDPGGDCRKAKEYFRKARAAYRKQDAKAFREASADFLAAVRKTRSGTRDLSAAENDRAGSRLTTAGRRSASLGFSRSPPRFAFFRA